ncbi:MAG: CPBP family intramembrane metalloprotease [Clostridia bacterium]|nr:CPBP family intramembrane metalloprotease [Clostridia bacterium]
MQENFSYEEYAVFNEIKRENRNGIRKLGFVAGMCVLLYICLSFVLGELLTVTGLRELASKSDVVNHALGIIISFLCVFVPFFIISLSKRHNILETLTFEKPNSYKSSAALIVGGFGLLMVSNLFATLIAGILSLLGHNPNMGVAQVPIGTTVFGFIMYSFKIAVIPALTEEFAIRGVLMQPLRKYGDWFAIITSSAVFALMHGEFIQGIFAFLAGVILGYVVVSTGTIWTGVILHFINNMFSVIISGIGLKNIYVANTVYWVAVILSAIVAWIVLTKFFSSDNAYNLKKVETGLTAGQKFFSYIFNFPIIVSMIFITISIVKSIG